MISSVMEAAGQVVFDNLPLLFAVGTALGLAGGDGVAALAALVGYLIMNATMGKVLHITIDDIFICQRGKRIKSSSERTSTCLSIRYSNVTNGCVWWYYHGAFSRMVLQQIL